MSDLVSHLYGDDNTLEDILDILPSGMEEKQAFITGYVNQKIKNKSYG